MYIIKARGVSISAPRLWVKLSQLLTVRLRLYWKKTGQEVKPERVSQKDKGHFEGQSPLPPQFTFHLCNYIKVVMCPKSPCSNIYKLRKNTLQMWLEGSPYKLV